MPRYSKKEGPQLGSATARHRSSNSNNNDNSNTNSSSSSSSGMRKVLYDDYTQTFYVENRLEAMHRQIESRAQQTHVLNRSHDTSLRFQLKQVNAEHVIFSKKNVRESTFHKEQLQDHVAHRRVLNSIARAKINVTTGRRAESHLGFYGLGASKVNIQPQIEQTIKQNTSSALRRKKSFRILRDRAGVPVFDRTKTTSALFRMKSEIQSRPTTDFKTRRQGDVNQLILPPITVTWANTSSSGIHEPAATRRGDSSVDPDCSTASGHTYQAQQAHCEGGEETAANDCSPAVVDDSLPLEKEFVFVTQTQS